MKNYINLQLREVFLKNGFTEVANFNNHCKLIYPKYPTNFVIVNNGSLDSKGFPAIYKQISESELKTLICYLSLPPRTQSAIKKYAGKDLSQIESCIKTIIYPEKKSEKLPLTKKTVDLIKNIFETIILN